MRISIVALAAALIVGVAPALAQTYPSRTITLIVPFPPTWLGASSPSTWAKRSVSR
jgi:hypothetical protein